MSALSQQVSGRGRCPRVPKYCRHKTWDLAYVRIGGKVKYLGPHKSPESLEAYSRIVAEFAAAPAAVERVIAAADDPSMTVTELCDKYLTYAESYYRKDGRLTDQIGNVRRAIRMLRALYSSTPAGEFGPLGLKAIQEHMLKNPGVHPQNKQPIDYTRGTINSTCDCIRRIFKWAASDELLPVTIYTALTTVSGLKKGRCSAREPAPVAPVADAIVEITLPHLPPVVRDMVQFQRLTGARPGEVCNLRPMDLDRSAGKVWRYRPASHKTQHKDRERVVFVGPRAEAILTPYLLRGDEVRPLDVCCFSPAESEALRRVNLRTRRKTRVQPSQLGRRKKAHPKRVPAAFYNKDSYRRAIAKAIGRANRKAKAKADEAKRKGLTEGTEAELIPLWKPNQLRHSAGTEVRSKFGLEAAQTILGHANAKVTEIYAERDFARAADVAEKIG